MLGSYGDENGHEREDKRPDHKPRKNIRLWQAYLWWRELMLMRQKHTLRIVASLRGKSAFDPEYEYSMLRRMGEDVITFAENDEERQAIQSILDRNEGKTTIGINGREVRRAWLDGMVDPQTKGERRFSAEESMIDEGRALGEIWDWATSIKGLGGGGLAAQLLAQIDDIGKFDTISKLWRFCSYAVIDGKREYNAMGEKSHYNRRLKSTIWLIVDQFIKQQTPIYVDVYYEAKTDLRRKHPTAICEECGVDCIKTTNKDGHSVYRCPNNAKHYTKYSDKHIHLMAMRKVSHIFLSHLWIKWREFDGLPITKPYAEAILGHENIIRP